MTRVSCPSCRLRFTGAGAVHLTVCPHCGGPAHRSQHATSLLGHRLVSLPPSAVDLAQPDAIAVALPDPSPRERT